MNQRLAALQSQIADAASPEDRQERANASLSRYLVGPIKVLSRENSQKSRAALQTLVTDTSQTAGSRRLGIFVSRSGRNRGSALSWRFLVRRVFSQPNTDVLSCLK